MALLYNCPAFGEQLNMATEANREKCIVAAKFIFLSFHRAHFFLSVHLYIVYFYISILLLEMPCPSPRSLVMFVPHLTQTHTNLLMCEH